MARSMNMVAMCNCGQSRAMAMAPVLDSLPAATSWSFNEVAQWEAHLAWQLQQPLHEKPQGLQLIRNGLDGLRRRMETQRAMLAPLNAAINGGSLDMRNVTWWHSPASGTQGSLWQMAVSLDELARATVESAGALAQSDAGMFGQGEGVDTAFLAPLLPRMPAVHGQFSQFRPVLQGHRADRPRHRPDRPNGGKRRRDRRHGVPPPAGALGGAVPLARPDYRATAWRWVEPPANAGRSPAAAAASPSAGDRAAAVPAAWAPAAPATGRPRPGNW